MFLLFYQHQYQALYVFLCKFFVEKPIQQLHVLFYLVPVALTLGYSTLHVQCPMWILAQDNAVICTI